MGTSFETKFYRGFEKANFFSIIADEATDTANDEQLSITIRFVENGIAQEKFLAFSECQSGVTGKAIADNILAHFMKW